MQKRGSLDRQLWLRDAVYCGDVGEAIVFLNLPEDRYLALLKTQCHQLPAIVGNWPLASNPGTGEMTEAELEAIAKKLIESNIISEIAPKIPSATPALIAATQSLNTIDILRVSAKPCATTVVRFLSAYVNAGLRYRLLSLYNAVKYLNRRRKRTAHLPAEISEEFLVRIIGLFIKCRALTYTAHDRCIVDSLVLWEFLQAYGIDSKFVIGVRLRPFGSHCWIQRGRTVLNDTHENAGSFVPILSV